MDIGKIIVFDGHCNLCSGLVQFLIKADRKKEIMYAAAQSPSGERLIKEHRLEDVGLTVYFIEDGKVYDRSQAVFHIASALGFPYSLILVFGILGRPLCDALYSIVARNRLSLFGRSDFCYVPTEEMKANFIH